MSVRQSLLAILDQGPCYGSQLRAEYARRTLAAPLNIGQVYTTLERLERDGLVARDGADEWGHVYWRITTAGRAEARGWFAAPDTRGARDELAHKLALAATLPGVDAAAVVAVQRVVAAERVGVLEGQSPTGGVHTLIVHAAALAHARADLAWLDAVADGIDRDAASGTFGLSAERPRRGRPAREAQAG